MAIYPDYGGLTEGNYGMGVGSTGGAPQAGAGLASYAPYLQALLGAYQASRGPSGTQQVEHAFSSAAHAQGLNPVTPDQPGNQSASARAGRSIGAAALNAIPVVGGVASALGGMYNSDVDARAKQHYLQQLLAANPGMVDPGQIGLQSEYVPQTNFGARYAQSLPGGVQRAVEGKYGMMGTTAPTSLDFSGSPGALEKSALHSIPKPGWMYEKMGGVGDKLSKVDAAFSLGRSVMGAKEKQKQREEEIHKRNLAKAKSAEESQSVTAQDALVRKRSAQSMTASQLPQRNLALQQMLIQRLLSPLQQRFSQQTQPQSGGIY